MSSHDDCSFPVAEIFYAASTVTKSRIMAVDILLKIVCVLFIPWKEISVLSPLLKSNILKLF